MATAHGISQTPIRDQVSAEEWALRVDLAAAGVGVVAIVVQPADQGRGDHELGAG